MMADRLPAETPERGSREARRKEKIMKELERLCSFPDRL